MKIRSVTLCADMEKVKRSCVEEMLCDARTAYCHEVDTTRITTVPQNGRFSDKRDALRVAVEYDEWVQSAGIDYIGGFGLGNYPSKNDLSFLDWIPSILSSTQRVFSNCQLAWDRTVSIAGISKCANIVRDISLIDDGFLNLKFAGMYNCEPDNPFYPASYASGDEPCFVLSLEAADLAVAAFKNSETLEDARDNLLSLIRDLYCEILSTSLMIEEQHKFTFGGVDFTLAPSSKDEGSIAYALEKLGLGAFGSHGTLFLSSFLSDTIKSLGEQVGFSGLMYPVLEDTGIAARVAEGYVSIDSLMAYSAVCGTGLDCVPLPGNISKQSLSAIMLDIASLSIRLKKPLTTRLFPVPGKVAGEKTTYDFDYFSNTTVMGTKQGALGTLDGDEFKFII